MSVRKRAAKSSIRPAARATPPGREEIEAVVRRAISPDDLVGRWPNQDCTVALEGVIDTWMDAGGLSHDRDGWAQAAANFGEDACAAALALGYLQSAGNHTFLEYRDRHETAEAETAHLYFLELFTRVGFDRLKGGAGVLRSLRRFHRKMSNAELWELTLGPVETFEEALERWVRKRFGGAGRPRSLTSDELTLVFTAARMQQDLGRPPTVEELASAAGRASSEISAVYDQVLSGDIGS